MKITSHDLAQLCDKAYDTHTIEAAGTEVLIEDRGDFVVWAFRGTEKNYGEILDDLRGYPWWSKEVGTFVHRGFLVGAKAIWPELPMAGYQSKPVVLTGHSKGGAEAILIGAFMVQLGIPPVLIETFGAPRVGFAGLGELLEGVPGERHKLGIDAIPSVPPAGFLVRYRHDRDLTEHDTDNLHLFENHRIADYISAVT